MNKALTAPRQARSRETLERFLSAAEELFARKGIAATTVAEIAEAAGSSVGAFYTRFRDKDGFLSVFYERFFAQGREELQTHFAAERWEGKSAGELIRYLVDLRISQYRARKALVHSVVMHVRSHPEPEFRRLAGKYAGESIGQIHDLLVARARQFGHRNPDVAVKWVITIIEATLRETIVFGDRRSPSLSTNLDEIREELTRACLAYLGVRK